MTPFQPQDKKLQDKKPNEKRPPEKLKALFVDDEPHILESLTQIFDRTYSVSTATSGKDALEFVRLNPDLAIVISDQRMPGMKGIEVLKAIKELSPDTMRILLTGYADADAILDSVNVGEVFRYIKKPWEPENLKHIVSLAAATYAGRAVAKLSASKPATTSIEPVAAEPVVAEPPVAESRIVEPAVEAAAPVAIANELHTQAKIEERFFTKLYQEHQGSAVFEKAFHGQSGKPKILVVDDEQGVLTALGQLLADDYDVLTCSSANAAIELLEQDSFVTLLLTDQRMPKKTGTELLIESREFAPLIPKILITAYTDVEDIIRLINEGQIFRYIQKPWNPDKLRETIAEAVETYRVQVNAKLGAASNAETSAPEKSTDALPDADAPMLSLDALRALSHLAQNNAEV